MKKIGKRLGFAVAALGVAGAQGIASPAQGAPRAATAPTVITDVPGAAQLEDINDRGDVVGFWYDPTKSTRSVSYQGFIRFADGSRTEFTDPTGTWPRSIGVAVNRRGAVAGNFTRPRGGVTPPRAAFFWSARTGVVMLPPVDGETFLEATDIDDDGRVLVNGRGAHSYLYDSTSGTYEKLPSLGGAEEAVGMNDVGDIVGYATTPGVDAHHAVIWRGREHTITDLHGALPGDSFARSINDKGEIVGVGYLPENNVLFWGSATTPAIRLGLGSADQINNRGCIVGRTAAGPAGAWLVRKGEVFTSSITPTGSSFLSVNKHGVIATDNGTDPVLTTGCPER